MASPAPLPRLCLVTDSSVKMHAPIEEVVAEAVSGGVGYGPGQGEDHALRGTVRPCREAAGLVTRGKALLIINDRIDVALAVEADGVHLPIPFLALSVLPESLCGERLLIGRSVHSVEEAVTAEKEGADYLSPRYNLRNGIAPKPRARFGARADKSK